MQEQGSAKMDAIIRKGCSLESRQLQLIEPLAHEFQAFKVHFDAVQESENSTPSVPANKKQTTQTEN